MFNTIKFKLTAVVIGFLLIVSAMFVATFTITRMQKDDSLVINLAGRQRMLTQKMTKEALQFVSTLEKGGKESERLAGNLEETAEIFDMTLGALKDSGKAPLSLDLSDTGYRHCPKALEPAYSQLSKVEGIWKNFRKDLKSLLNDEIGRIEGIVNKNMSLLSQMNKAVSMMQKQSEKKVTALIKIQTGCVLAGILFTVFAVFFFRRTLGKPIEKLNRYAENIGRGDFSEKLEIDSQDEIGEIAAHLNGSVSSLSRIIKRMTDTSGTLLHFSRELAQVFDEMAAGSEKLNSQSGSVAASAEQITANVETAAAAAEETSSTVTDIAGRANEMSATVKNVADLAGKALTNVDGMAQSGELMSQGISNVAAAVEEMSTSLTQVSRNTEQAREISGRAGRHAEKVTAKMETLEKMSRNVGKIVTTIKDIADQTNMLALNAAIEAAGAGEAGKGFAVVANEVKELARQSAEASDEIAEQIEGIQASINDAVEAIEEINSVIQKNAGINRDIASAVEEQTATAGEISSNIADNSRSAQNVSKQAGKTSSLVADISGQVNETSSAAGDVAVNVSEISNASRDMAKSSSEISEAINEISGKMRGVNKGAVDIAAGVASVNKTASDLAQNSETLSEIVAGFDTGVEKFNISEVKNAHLAWRSKLDAVLRGKSALTSDDVSSDHECEFGKWYFGEQGRKFKGDPMFEEIGKHHQEVHQLAAKVVMLYENNRKNKAGQTMQQFETARDKLFKALEEFYVS